MFESPQGLGMIVPRIVTKLPAHREQGTPLFTKDGCKTAG